jgi:hypothetical protein
MNRILAATIVSSMLIFITGSSLFVGHTQALPAPTVDNVRFPSGYRASYTLFYTFDNYQNRQIRAVYGRLSRTFLRSAVDCPDDPHRLLIRPVFKIRPIVSSRRDASSPATKRRVIMRHASGFLVGCTILAAAPLAAQENRAWPERTFVTIDVPFQPLNNAFSESLSFADTVRKTENVTFARATRRREGRCSIREPAFVWRTTSGSGSRPRGSSAHARGRST